MPSCRRGLCRYPEEVLHGRCKPHVQKVQGHSGQVRVLQQGLGTVSALMWTFLFYSILVPGCKIFCRVFVLFFFLLFVILYFFCVFLFVILHIFKKYKLVVRTSTY